MLLELAGECLVCPVNYSSALEQISARLAKIENIELKIDAFAEKIDSMQTKADKLVTDYSGMQKSVKLLEDRVSKVENIKNKSNVDNDLIAEVKSAAQSIVDSSLELRALQLESHSLADEIILGGIPESDGKKLTDVVTKLTKKLEIPVTEKDIVKAERLGRHGRAGRKIRVKFNNQKYVDNLMSNIKGKSVKVGDLLSNTESPGAVVYMHRRHPSSLYQLRQDVRKRYPNILPRNIWISYSSVNIRYADDKSPVKLLPSTGLSPLEDLINYQFAAPSSPSANSTLDSSSVTTYWNSTQRHSKSSLKLCHINAQSLRNEQHFELFKEYFRTHKYDVIAVSETWLNHLISDNLVSLSLFMLYRRDRHLRSGGGVALYIRNYLVFRHGLSSANADDKHPEFIFVEISGTSRDKVVLGVVYKPPNIGHLDDLEEELEAITASYKNIIILGDFNSDLSKKNFYGDQLRCLCEDFNLKIVQNHPTHHLKNSDSWIDVCIVDDYEKAMGSEQSSKPFLSDHDLISLTYNYKVGRQGLNRFSYRNWDAVNEDLLQNLCDDFDIDTMRSLETVDEMNSYLHEHLDRIIDIVAPEKTICPQRPPSP